MGGSCDPPAPACGTEPCDEDAGELAVCIDYCEVPASLHEECDNDPCDSSVPSCGPGAFCATSIGVGGGRSYCVSGLSLFADCVPSVETLGVVGCGGDAYCQPASCLDEPIEGIEHGICSTYRGEGKVCDGEQVTRDVSDCSVCRAGLDCTSDPTTRDRRCRKPCESETDCPCGSICLDEGFCFECKDDGETCGNIHDLPPKYRTT